MADTTPNILAQSNNTLVDSATEGVISCTRAELGKLGNWCKRTAEVFIVAGAVAAGANNALGQTAPNTQQVAMLTPVSYTTNTRSQQQTANLTTIPASPAVSADAASANGYGQTVNTPFGNLSFAEIQVHEKKDEILVGLKPSKRDGYRKWEGQMANQEGKIIDTRIQAANQNNQAKLEVEKAANQEGKIIDTRIQAANQKIIREITILINRIEKNESLLRNNEIVKNLQEVYDKPEIFNTNEYLLSKIQTLIIKAEKYHDQFGG